MDNIDRPNGFTCITPHAKAHWYQADASKTNNIGIGDAVHMETDGYLIMATAGATIRGIVKGVRTATWGYVKSSGTPINYLPSATAGWVYVIDDPRARFVIQTDGYTTGTTSVAKSCEGSNFDILATACDTSTGMSKHEIDADGDSYVADPTLTRQLRVIGLYDAPNNAYSTSSDGQWTRLEVEINEHELKTTSGI